MLLTRGCRKEKKEGNRIGNLLSEVSVFDKLMVILQQHILKARHTPNGIISFIKIPLKTLYKINVYSSTHDYGINQVALNIKDKR